MRIKFNFINKRVFVRIGLVLFTVTFYTYFGYKDLFFDVAAQPEIKIQKQLLETAKAEVKPKEFYGIKRADIAMQEFRKNVLESPMGSNSGPQVDMYTQGYHSQWCTMFASWVTMKAGSPVADNLNQNWRITNSRKFTEYLKEHGTWHDSAEITQKGLQPEIGDFVIFWRGDYEDNLGHVDIVVDVGDEIGRAGMIGGNLNGGVKYRNFSFAQNYGFLGFGHPEKESN